MHNISDNLKFLRKKQKWTQADFAKQLGVKRSMIGAYEEGRADPRISFLQLICDKFKLSLDELINLPLGENKKKERQDISGRSLRILPITIDRETDQETASLVPIKAAAGYLNGFGDVEFMEQLPTFRLPFPELPKGKTYRLFQIKGESMLPIQSGSYVICSYEMDWNNILNDRSYVIISKSGGIVFKRILNNLKQGKLTLKSDNTEFETYDIDIDDVIEIWRAEGLTTIGMEYEAPRASMKNVAEEISQLNHRLDRIENKLSK